MRTTGTIKAGALAVLIAAPMLAEGAGIALPSGREVAFYDTIWASRGLPG